MARRKEGKKIVDSPKIEKAGGKLGKLWQAVSGANQGEKRLYKTDVVRRVAKETRLSQRVVSDALKGTLREITLALARDQLVVFPGFGLFYPRMRHASTARSFKTGEPVKVPAMRVAAFRAGGLLKQAVRKRKKTT